MQSSMMYIQTRIPNMPAYRLLDARLVFVFGLFLHNRYSSGTIDGPETAFAAACLRIATSLGFTPTGV